VRERLEVRMIWFDDELDCFTHSGQGESVQSEG
jgi:hypothetical protein